MTTATRACRCTRPLDDKSMCAHCDARPDTTASSCAGNGCTDCWERDRRCTLCRTTHQTKTAALHCENVCRRNENRTTTKEN